MLSIFEHHFYPYPTSRVQRCVCVCVCVDLLKRSKTCTMFVILYVLHLAIFILHCSWMYFHQLGDFCFDRPGHFHLQWQVYSILFYFILILYNLDKQGLFVVMSFYLYLKKQGVAAGSKVCYQRRHFGIPGDAQSDQLCVPAHFSRHGDQQLFGSFLGFLVSSCCFPIMTHGS